jgi:quinol monooxygenase YgiN
MFSLVVRFDLQDGAAAARFDSLTANVVEKIITEEPGTLVYATHAVDGEPLSRVFYEVYADQESFQAHEKAEHVKEFHARKSPLLRGEPRVEYLLPGSAKGLSTT